MLTYILVTLTILIVILCFTVFYEHRQINQLTLTVQRNFADMAALRHILDGGHMRPHHQSGDGDTTTMAAHENEFPFVNDDVIDEQESDATTDDNESTDETDGGSNENSKDVVAAEDDSNKGLDEIDAVLDQMENEEAPTVTATTGGTKEIEVEITATDKGKKTATVPNEPAKNYEDGYKMLSSNDNNYYVVTSTKAGVKRWRKVE